MDSLDVEESAARIRATRAGRSGGGYDLGGSGRYRRCFRNLLYIPLNSRNTIHVKLKKKPRANEKLIMRLTRGSCHGCQSIK